MDWRPIATARHTPERSGSLFSNGSGMRVDVIAWKPDNTAQRIRIHHIQFNDPEGPNVIIVTEVAAYVADENQDIILGYWAEISAPLPMSIDRRQRHAESERVAMLATAILWLLLLITAFVVSALVRRIVKERRLAT
jgi:hypothetical protein